MENQLFINSQNSDSLVARYEGLRGRVPGEEKTSRSEYGMVLFLRRGMAAWMKAWSECAPGYTAQPREGNGGGVALPAGARSEMATILAGMALSVVTNQGHDVKCVTTSPSGEACI